MDAEFTTTTFLLLTSKANGEVETSLSPGAVTMIAGLSNLKSAFASTMPLSLVATEDGEGITAPVALQDPSLRRADRDQIILENLPTVRFIARRIAERLPQHVELEELISAGMVGLIDAVEKFNPKRQVQFKSYAQFRIRGAILDSLRTLDWSPRELRRKGRGIEESIVNLTARLGRTPAEGEIADELGMPLPEYQALLGELKGLEIGSLNEERGEEGGEEELAFVASPENEDPLFRCMQEQKREHLATALEGLPEKERLVLSLYYHEELTMKEVGLTLGVVESRVSQIHSSAILHLRAALRKLQGEEIAPAAKKLRR